MQMDKGQPEFGPNPSRACSTKPLVTHLSGSCYLQRDPPPISLLPAELGSRPALGGSRTKPPSLRTGTGLISFLINAAEIDRARGIAEDRTGLPAGLWRLLELAEASGTTTDRI
jgi:hypothetical protein